jgi:hypothetical protein
MNIEDHWGRVTLLAKVCIRLELSVVLRWFSGRDCTVSVTDSYADFAKPFATLNESIFNYFCFPPHK